MALANRISELFLARFPSSVGNGSHECGVNPGFVFMEPALDRSELVTNVATQANVRDPIGPSFRVDPGTLDLEKLGHLINGE